MDTDQFITLCDGTPAAVWPAGKAAPTYQEECVNIRDPLTVTGEVGSPFAEFKRLRTGFIYLSYIDKSKDYAPYYYILEKISGYFNGSTPKIAEWTSKVWKDVIAYCKSLPEYPRTNDFQNGLTRVEERERAMAATRLRSLGAHPTVENCELKMENVQAVYDRIEELMTEIGGVNALNFLVKGLPFIKETGRFFVPHQGNAPIPNAVDLETPYGYLFYLSIKHIKDKGATKGIERKWKELDEICKDFCFAVYDVQKFDMWKYIVFPHSDVVKIVHDLVLMFDLYTLPQTNVSFTLDWCRYLCKHVVRDKRCDAVLVAKLKSIQLLMNWAMSLSDNDTCTVIKKSSGKSRLLECKKAQIEPELLVKAEGVNASFVAPIDFEKVNSMRYPIIERDDDYVLLPRPLVAWNWCEAILNIIRPYKALTKDIGYVIEDYIDNKLRTHGIISHDGYYQYQDEEGKAVEGEVDYLIEATEGDLIIESKKKSFTLPARSGDNVRIWGDLCDFIYSQMQCSRLENGVRQFGPIVLTEGRNGTDYQYNWKEKCQHTDEDGTTGERLRRVVRVTMTMKEYGPMQDKVVLVSILNSLLGKKIDLQLNPVDDTYSEEDKKRAVKTFDVMNEALLDLTKYSQAMGMKRPTMFSRFLSMEQLYFLIKKSKGQDHFFKLVEGGFVTTGTLNFWNEYLNTKSIYEEVN